jgi:hypothetical protein
MQLGTEAPVEPDRGAIPVEHRPLHPPAAPLPGHGSHGAQQRSSHAPAPLVGEHEQILQVERGSGQERRVGEVIEGESHRVAAPPADERLEVPSGAEAVAVKTGHGRLDLMRQPLVVGQAADQGENRRHIAGRGAADAEAGRGHRAAAAAFG